MTRGSAGGPLTPLADQLNQDLTHLQGQHTAGMLDRIVEALADLAAVVGQRSGEQAAARAVVMVRADTARDAQLADAVTAYIEQSGFQVIDPLRAPIGGSVAGAALVGVNKGLPLVVLGTEHTAGDTFCRHIVYSAREHDSPIYVLQMEERADLRAMALGEPLAQFWQNPEGAMESPG